MNVATGRSTLRTLLPQSVRECLYEWHPGRARRWQRYPGIERVAPGGRAVLTFDDGPDLDATPAVLEALDAVGARATFFLLGVQVERHPEIAREVLARGHEVGLHGHNHLRHDREDASVSRDDLRRGLALIEDRLGVRCEWFRPPYGKVSAASAETCAELGIVPVYWSGWGLDWEPVSSRRIADVVTRQIDDGGIILLHDSARYARRSSAIPTAEALPMIGRHAAEAGLALVCLRDSVSSHMRVGGPR